MKTNATTLALVGGLVLAGGAAALYRGEPEMTATPEPAAPSATTEAPAAAAPAPGQIAGKVAEVIPVESYTYLRLEDGTWAAVPSAQIAVGDDVAIANASLMRDFESKTLNRTFPAIYFGQLANGAGAPPPVADGKLPAGHPPIGVPPSPAGHGAPAAPSPAAEIDIPRIDGGVTVAELFSKAAELEGKKVTFAGRIVKVSMGILGRNWLHVQDGTGEAAAKTNDVVVTTQAAPKVGDTAAITGTLVRDKDLGSGYRYDVLVEDATLDPLP